MRNRLQQEIGIIKQNNYLPYFSDGSWSMHELLEYIIAQVGPSDVNLTAFSISEESVRSLFFLQEDNMIRNLNCIFNKEIRRFKTDLSFFAQKVCKNIHLANIHAKLILIKNDLWSIAIVSSQNFSNNKRYEAGMIISNTECFDFFNTKFLELWLNSQEL
jgi:hypothetical protein